MGSCRSKICIRNNNIFISRYKKYCNCYDTSIAVDILFEKLDEIPNLNIKIDIIRTFNKIIEEYKIHYLKLDYNSKEYYRSLIKLKWDARFKYLQRKFVNKAMCMDNKEFAYSSDFKFLSQILINTYSTLIKCLLNHNKNNRLDR